MQPIGGNFELSLSEKLTDHRSHQIASKCYITLIRQTLQPIGYKISQSLALDVWIVYLSMINERYNILVSPSQRQA